MAAAGVPETERTYVGDAAGGPPPGTREVRAALERGTEQVASLEELEPVDLDAVYFDTADLRLAARRITLRRRTGGDDDGWHLKLPTTEADTRTEVHAPLGSGTPRTVPKALSAQVAVHTRGRPLRPVVRVVNHRERTRLLDAAGGPLAEVAHDHVTAGPLSWTETEVELMGGEPSLLDAVEERLLAAGLRRAAVPSKLRRALGDRVPVPPGPPERADTAGEAVLRHLHRLVADLTGWDPPVRRDEPDAVHQMRVTTRRLRAALRTYRRELDRAVTDPVGEELKWLAGVLGEERDREVLDARLAALVALLPPEAATDAVRGGPPGGPDRERSRERLLRRMRGTRYFALLDRLDALLADPPLLDAAGRPAADALAAAVRREHRRLRGRLRDAAAAAPGPARDVALHEARKAAKRARYAAESAAPVLGRPAERYRSRITRLQRLLGEHQDGVMCRAEILRRTRAARRAGEDTFGHGVMYQAERERAAAVEDALPAAWRRADRGPLAG